MIVAHQSHTSIDCANVVKHFLNPRNERGSHTHACILIKLERKKKGKSEIVIAIESTSQFQQAWSKRSWNTKRMNFSRKNMRTTYISKTIETNESGRYLANWETLHLVANKQSYLYSNVNFYSTISDHHPSFCRDTKKRNLLSLTHTLSVF